MDFIEKEKNACLLFFCESRTLFTGPTSTDFSKIFFKIGSHSTIHTFKNYFTYNTIHTFKNYFTTVFSIFKNKRYSNRPLMKKKIWIVDKSPSFIYKEMQGLSIIHWSNSTQPLGWVGLYFLHMWWVGNFSSLPYQVGFWKKLSNLIHTHPYIS